MAEFKVGEKVTGRGFWSGFIRTGAVIRYAPEYGEGAYEIKDGPDEFDRRLIKDVTRVQELADRPLVGPAPEPVEGSIYVAPFEVDEGHVFVLDATGDPVVSCNWGRKTHKERVAFAAFVRDALNAKASR